MLHALAKANLNDTSDTLPLLLIACAILAACALLAFIPIRIARNRRHRFADPLTAAFIVWAIVTAASIILAVNQHFEFAAEQRRMMTSGFLDIAVRTPPPTWPWPLWLALAVLYALLLLLASRAKSPEPPPP
jgi:hypothetical protein